MEKQCDSSCIYIPVKTNLIYEKHIHHLVEYVFIRYDNLLDCVNSDVYNSQRVIIIKRKTRDNPFPFFLESSNSLYFSLSIALTNTLLIFPRISVDWLIVMSTSMFLMFAVSFIFNQTIFNLWIKIIYFFLYFYCLFQGSHYFTIMENIVLC